MLKRVGIDSTFGDRSEHSEGYRPDATVLMFVGFLHPLEELEPQLQSYARSHGAGTYVIYSGASVHGDKGMTEPSTLKKAVYEVAPPPEPEPATVEKV